MTCTYVIRSYVLCMKFIERLQVTSQYYVIHFRVAKTVSVARVLLVDMVRSCCAYNCTARDNKTTREVGVQFYRIPQNKAKRTLWLNAINRKGFNTSSSTVICSQHFVGGKYVFRL